MKLKDRDLTEVAQRFGVTGPKLLQENQSVRAALLAAVVCCVAILAGIAFYLVWVYPPPHDSEPGVITMREWVRK
jgi:hypothetical protein